MNGSRILAALNALDRRWIFLAIFVAVSIPVITRASFPEKPTLLTQKMFDYIEGLEPGSRIFLAFDYDPNSAAELDPMATAVLRHCCAKRHRIYAATLWPTGVPLMESTLQRVISEEFASRKYEYGRDYVNLGYVSGEAIAAKLLAADIVAAREKDARNNSVATLPIMEGVKGAKDMDALISISAGFPGLKEWVQYAGTPYGIATAGGCTGVAAPQLYPYFPNQLFGLMAAIKGAAEYEAAFQAAWPEFKTLKARGIQRMGPQLFGHRVVIGLIVLGNVIYFWNRRRAPR